MVHTHQGTLPGARRRELFTGRDVDEPPDDGGHSPRAGKSPNSK